MSMSSIPLYHLELVRDRSVPFRSLEQTEQCAEVLHELLDKSPVEQMAVLYVDASFKLVGVEKVGLGTTTMVMVTMAEIFRGAITASVPMIVLGHNHPSDDPTPSGPDWNLTDKARVVGKDLGIEILDHIIVTPTGKHVSMKREDFKQQDQLLGSLMGMADLLPPEERKKLEDKIRMLGIDPATLPRGDIKDLPPLPPGRMGRGAPPIGTNLGDLLRKKLMGGR